jgi:lipoprotein NlpD
LQMSAFCSHAVRATASCVSAAILAACGTTRMPAPVEDRAAASQGISQPAAQAAIPSQADAVAKPLPGSENAGKPGYYTVRPGDTLMRIGLENGQAWRDVARWNNLENVNIIEVGQVLRVVPPGIDPATIARPVLPARADGRPLDAKPPMPGASGVIIAAAGPAASQAMVVPAPAAAAPGDRSPDDDIPWMWPASGSVASGFEENRTRGMAITGKAGDPVYAAADGRVIYAGSGLRGYGNLVILKHNNSYLSAYAHNSVLLVKEDQAVRRGQKIAEMGASDADRVQLHFEIRKQGKPVDPARFLPAR